MEKKFDATAWPPSLLQEARKRKDPLADNFVAELAKTKSQAELFGFMQLLLNEYVWIDHQHLDEFSSNYLKAASQLPSWANPVLIKKGEDFFALHGFEISMVLNMKALPATYACWRGAEVVHSSGRMTQHSGNLRPFTRRLMQTSKFVLNVLTPGGLSESGPGIQSAVKVRTLHAFIRYFLECKDWNAEKFGAPINQEDYAGTMLSFSVFVVEGLERLGITVSDEEKEAYFHVWRVAAYVVGVDDDLIANDYNGGAILGHTILDDQKGYSKHGAELTQACVDFLHELMPWRIIRFLPNEMMYYLLGDEIAEMVGIRKSRNPFVAVVFFLFRMALRVFEWLKHHVGFVKRWAMKYTPILLDRVIKTFLDETRNMFSPKILENEVKTITEKYPDGRR